MDHRYNVVYKIKWMYVKMNTVKNIKKKKNLNNNKWIV
jgi:hypothetical protein